MAAPSIEVVFSGTSLAITLYYWFIQARRERPQLRIYQIGSFRAACRRHQKRDDARRLCVQQLDSCGVLIANNSIRQNSIVLFDCWLLLPDGQELRGDWGTVGDDRPPWNVGPESTIAMGLACFFDVPLAFEVPDSFEIGVEFISASGQRYSHRFAREAPAFNTDTDEKSQAA
ncbi:MAG: hypothetical protein GY903_14870 [Fuerstiella sp.]|nr:hypothetical protein [Fuerstiella sp.]MCP4784968.1 hypothetical protein [Fuerstiella sp.]MCP4855766.1 hypothetical protein [Fuerstiella sp.]